MIPTHVIYELVLIVNMKTFLKGSQWDVEDMSMWAWSDYLDLPDPYIGDEPQLYDVNANAYESLMLGLFAIYQGPTTRLQKEMESRKPMT
ncbi:MAG: hypothetical protein CM1200mP3_04440 [Chloroflexota bacterium]|nr:MAG: hypothetical protein CM1200mP3_04440 [Chloroflexota bacterium]